MALVSIISKTDLASPLILAPERYDPRRELKVSKGKSVELGEIAASVPKMVKPSDELGRCLIINTSDAREGIITARKQTVMGKEIGSTKKKIAKGDVIISRLRPYLRQVAFIDRDISSAKDALILCSTEFFVLRSIDNQPIAFLVPFLLSKKVQKVLAASQEGGHHPRFIESTLLTLPVPIKLLSQRNKISEKVAEGIKLYRFSENTMVEMIEKVDRAFKS